MSRRPPVAPEQRRSGALIAPRASQCRTRPAPRAFVEAVQDFWLHEYHLDGFRYDATRFIEGGPGSGIGHLAWHAQSTKPWAYRIAEHIPEDPGILGWTAFDACWHDAFRWTVAENLREDAAAGWGSLDALMAVLDPRRRGYGGSRQAVNYLENHDQERVIAEVARNPWLAPHGGLVAAKARLGLVTLAVHRWDDHGDDVDALLNFSNEPQGVPLAFPRDGPWNEYLEGGSVAHVRRDAFVTVPPSGALLFAKWKNW